MKWNRLDTVKNLSRAGWEYTPDGNRYTVGYADGRVINGTTAALQRILTGRNHTVDTAAVAREFVDAASSEWDRAHIAAWKKHGHVRVTCQQIDDDGTVVESYAVIKIAADTLGPIVADRVDGFHMFAGGRLGVR